MIKVIAVFINICFATVKCASVLVTDENNNEDVIVANCLCFCKLATANWDDVDSAEQLIKLRTVTGEQDLVVKLMMEYFEKPDTSFDKERILNIMRILNEDQSLETCVQSYVQPLLDVYGAGACKVNFCANHKGFEHYAKCITYTLLDIACSDTQQNEAKTQYDEITMTSMVKDLVCEYVEILKSVYSLRWDTPSKSFDDTDITYTRPGVGVVLKLVPDIDITLLVDKPSHLLVLKTRSAAIHITVGQVDITFDKKRYVCESLPCNILDVLQTYLKSALKESMDASDISLVGEEIQLTDNLVVLGKDYPSHLAVEVSFKNVSDKLVLLKKKANMLIRWWMLALHDVMKVAAGDSTIHENEDGFSVCGEGWKLSIRFTGNKDYKTHITLGVLDSGSKKYNDYLIKYNGDCNRTIDPMLSSEDGKPENNILMSSRDEILQEIMRNQLLSIDTKDIISYKMLSDEVTKLKHGETEVDSKTIMKEWQDYKQKSINKMAADYLYCVKNKRVRVSKLQFGVVNMDRIQNFEPVQ